MTLVYLWLTKLILSHLVTDFLLQRSSWIEERYKKHFAAPSLYLHVLITAGLAWAIIGFRYWPIALIIFITHLLIDGWKSYQKSSLGYFLFDQFLHFLVILACWAFFFAGNEELNRAWSYLNENPLLWKLLTAFVFLTTPSSYFVGQFTQKWREQIEQADSLAHAGKWIGMVERIIILIFVLYGQYAAIGLLVAAKAIIRFNEKDRPEVKTEYLVLGTLMSMGLAILTGLLAKI